MDLRVIFWKSTSTIRKLSESGGIGSPLTKSGCGYVGVHGGEMDLKLDCVWVNGRKLVSREAEAERERDLEFGSA